MDIWLQKRVLCIKDSYCTKKGEYYQILNISSNYKFIRMDINGYMKTFLTRLDINYPFHEHYFDYFTTKNKQEVRREKIHKLLNS